MVDPMELGKLFPVRRSKAQKEQFRSQVKIFAEDLGYVYGEEKTGFGGKNVVIGDPEKAKYLITAHYDTCSRMFFPNIVTPCNFWIYAAYQFLIVGVLILASILLGVIPGILFQSAHGGKLTAVAAYWVLLVTMLAGPANPSNCNDNTSGVVTVLEVMKSLPQIQREKVCFILFDLEEMGLIGSASYRKAHKKATENQLILNMDCVGDGDHILLIPTKKLKKDREKLSVFCPMRGYFGSKSIRLVDKGFTIYPSDQGNFPYGIAIAAFHKKKRIGYYYSRIHTPRDTVLDQTNVNLLRAAIVSFVCCDAAQ